MAGIGQTRCAKDQGRSELDLACDGAVAVLVTSAERARDLAQPPVKVIASAQGAGPIHTGLANWFSHTSSYDRRGHGGRRVDRLLFDRAGIEPSDVDVAEIAFVNGSITGPAGALLLGRE